MKKVTTIRLPEHRELWSTTLNMNRRWFCTHYSGRAPDHALGRFLVREYARRGQRPMHWRDALAYWNRNIEWRCGVGAWTSDQFWGVLRGTLERDIMRLTWLDEEGNLVEPWRDRPDDELFWAAPVYRA